MADEFIRQRALGAIRLLDDEDRKFVEAYIDQRVATSERAWGAARHGFFGLVFAVAIKALWTGGVLLVEKADENQEMRDLRWENVRLRSTCIDRLLMPEASDE